MVLPRRSASRPIRRGYAAAWDEVFAAALDRPARHGAARLSCREHHADRRQRDTLGLLDFQDALAGHPAYDLVSLLQDARRDVDPALESVMLARYKRITGAGEEFDIAYHVLGAQRNAKIVGIFTRLWKRDGKPRYPGAVPARLALSRARPRPIPRWRR